jgi:hypothetical protein
MAFYNDVRGVAMNFRKQAGLLSMAMALPLAALLTGCGDFWQAPGGNSSTSFSLANSGNISVTPGSTSTATITVTPENSFTGTVGLTCAITSTPSGATSPTTCSLNPTSVSISSASAETATLNATTSANTTSGAYEVTVTGTSSSSVAETTTVCIEVTTGSGSCGATASTSGVFYVLNATTDQIVAFNISSGSLNTVGAYTLANPPVAIAVAPNGQFLYVSTAAGIYLYTIGPGGALTLGNGGQAVSQDAAYTMQVDATNSWLVDAVSGVAQLNAIAINSSTGVLTSNSEQTFALPASTPAQLVISPGDSSSCTDCYVFVAMGSGGTEEVHFNPSNANPFGSAGQTGVLNSGGDNAVAVDPSNRLLYVGEADALTSGTQTGGLRVFTIASGGVTQLTGSPFPSGGTGPSAILPTSNGDYVYVANQAVSGSSSGNITGFSVTSTALTSIGSTEAGPSGRLGLAQDSTGSYVLAVDFAGSPDLEAYTIGSGTLSSTLSVATGIDPVGAVAIAAAP